MGVFFFGKKHGNFFRRTLADRLSVGRKTRGQEKFIIFSPDVLRGGQVCYHNGQYEMF